MKKFLGAISLALSLTLFTHGQSSKVLIKGTVTDLQSKLPVAGATVTLGNQRTLTAENGQFSFGSVSRGRYQLSVGSLGFSNYVQSLAVADTVMSLVIALTPTALFLEPLEVQSIRATERAPFAKTNLIKEEIAKSNLGQDIPILLNQLPSVVVNADAGNGVGYTGIRIRGSDATRINVTLNGIPYNDAESMGTYFVDLPDFASSVSSIQVQRGVGTSSNGAGAFGATINLATNEYRETAYTELNNSFGSFNTRKHTIKAGTGLINKRFTVDARLSKIVSDGFIDRAASDLRSFYISTAYLNKRASLRLNIFSGKEKTYQAWYGVPETMLSANRTYNPAGMEKPGTPYENQTDNYTQTHYQLFFNHAINGKWLFHTAAFLTRGKGYYEEYKAGAKYSSYGLPNPVVGGTVITTTDLVRQRWLDNYFFGQILSLQYKHNADEITLGGGWMRYNGKHFGTLPWMQTGSAPADYRYYNRPAVKRESHMYVKWQRRLSQHWSTFADLQYRYVNHNIDGFRANPKLQVNRSFHFINPKAGITYAHKGWQAYFSYAVGNKEPNRDDFEATLYRQPKHETMHDIEAGVEKKGKGYFAGANLYYMYYLNQLVLTGQINDVGAYNRTNVDKSYRLGVELQAAVTISRHLNISGNLAWSRNKIRLFTEYVDNYDSGGQDSFRRSNKDISFSPSVVAGSAVNILPVPQLECSFLNKYVGRQYLDNTQQEGRKLNAFYTMDFRASWKFSHRVLKEVQVIAQVNNIFNRRYEPNGYTYSYISGGALYTDNGYYPMAGTNMMVGLNVRL